MKSKVVMKAREIIRDDSKIKKFYFFPWLLSIIFLTFLLVYQSIYTYVVIFNKKEEALLLILDFFHSEYLIETLVVLAIFLVLYIIISPIFEWALIKYIDSKSKEEKTSISDCIWVWTYRFLPLFEYNNIFSEFKFISILNWYLFTLRFIWIEYIKYLSYLFLFVFFLSIFINVLFSYSKFEIVIWNKKAFSAVWASSKIAILNLKETIKLYFLMFLLNIRVIVNFFIFLSFPIIMVIVLWLITSKIFLYVAISIIVVLFVIVVMFLWYLAAVLEVFKTSIWYFAYIEWKEKLNNLEKEE